MTYGNPSALLADALATFPKHRERFEADFAHFCSYSGGIPTVDMSAAHDLTDKVIASAYQIIYAWARWAFWSAGDYSGRNDETV